MGRKAVIEPVGLTFITAKIYRCPRYKTRVGSTTIKRFKSFNSTAQEECENGNLERVSEHNFAELTGLQEIKKDCEERGNTFAFLTILLIL
jgi:hypothetical protein